MNGKKVEFHQFAKLLASQLLLDECERIGKQYTDIATRNEKAWKYLTELVPPEGIIDVQPRDWFGFGLGVAAYFATRDMERGLFNERKPEDDK